MSKPAPDTEITAAEAEVLLGVDRSAVIRMVSTKRLIPTRRFPGSNGMYLFDRAAVIALARERRAELEAQIARIGAA